MQPELTLRLPTEDEEDEFLSAHRATSPEAPYFVSYYTEGMPFGQYALTKNRYDFHMGRKLRGHLERAGFAISSEHQVPDRELSFDGPADSEVVRAWLERLNRMKGLRDLCGSSFERVRDDFVGALTRCDHRTSARVWCCIATA